MEKESPFSESSDYMEATSDEAATAISSPIQQNHLYAVPSWKENVLKEATVNLEKEIKSSEPSTKLSSLKKDAENSSPRNNDREKDLERIGNSACKESELSNGLNPSSFKTQHRHLLRRKLSEDKFNKEVSRKLERNPLPSSKSFEKEQTMKKHEKPLSEANGTKGKFLKSMDNTGDVSSDESTTSRSSGNQRQRSPSWKVNKDKCDKDLCLNLKKKTYSASKSSEKDHSLKTNVVKTFPETNRTREKDFISVSSIGESSSGVSVIADSSGIQPGHLHLRKTNGGEYNEVRKKLERKRGSTSKSPRKHSLKKNIKVSTPTRRSKGEANKIKPDDKDNSSSDAESNVDNLSKQPTNIPAKLSRSRSVIGPGNLASSRSGGTDAEKQTYHLNFGVLVPGKGSDHSDSRSSNHLPDTKISKTALRSPSTLPSGSAHDENITNVWLQAIREKEKHKKDSSEEVPCNSNTEFQKHRLMHRVREAIQTEIERKKLLSTSKEDKKGRSVQVPWSSSTEFQKHRYKQMVREPIQTEIERKKLPSTSKKGALVLYFPKSVVRLAREHRDKYTARETGKKEIEIKKPPRTSKEIACAQSSSKSMSIDKARSTEKRENKNEEAPITSKIVHGSNADSKEPTSEGSNENIDQSIPQSTPENKVGSKRLSDPSNALKDNRPFK